MIQEDTHYIAKLERAVRDKYGEKAIENPKKYWDASKEKDFLEQRNLFYKKIFSRGIPTTREKKKYKISSRFEARNKDRSCPVCEKYMFSNQEFAYIHKYESCKTCYIKYIEGREKRWLGGWRPNNK